MKTPKRNDPSHRRGGSLLVWDSGPLSLLATAGALHTAGHQCVCARHAQAAKDALTMSQVDVVVVDVGDDAPAVLDSIVEMRSMKGYETLPVVMIADDAWRGLERRVETMEIPTRALFKPIDPGSLLAVVDGLLWMPSLVQNHRRRGTRPGKVGWVTLD